MRIKCAETQLMYKRPNELGIIPKFSMILLFGLICLCKKLRREKAVYICRFAHGGDTFPLGTMGLLEGGSGLQEAYTKVVPIRPKKLPQHVGAMSWHHAKFHDFQACFWFTRIKKPSFSIFPAKPRCSAVWIWLPSLAWDLEIHPRTHMSFFKQLWCTGAYACSSNLNYAH